MAARSADEARFAHLYCHCYEPIWSYCSRRLDRDVVDDAVAETFLTVWRRMPEVPSGEQALVWMYGIAYRVIGHQWRSSARWGRLQRRLRGSALVGSAVVEETVVDRDEHRLVLAALALVGDTDAEVLRLTAWERQSVAEIAAVLGIEQNAVRQRLHRARRNLARQYGGLDASCVSRPTG